MNYEDNSTEEVETTSEVKSGPPTASQLLEWVRNKSGVVLNEWVKNPTMIHEGRVVFPGDPRAAKRIGSSSIVKAAINEFYPHVEANSVNDYSCKVRVKLGGRNIRVWIMESNFVVKLNPPELKKLDFPPYGTALRNSQVTTFLGVPGVSVQK